MISGLDSVKEKISELSIWKKHKWVILMVVWFYTGFFSVLLGRTYDVYTVIAFFSIAISWLCGVKSTADEVEE